MKIKNSKFERLDFFISFITSVSIILKTMIFIDIIKTGGEIKTYLQFRLFFRLYNKKILLYKYFWQF